MTAFDEEVKRGERFEFGKNWQSFLSTLTDEKIKFAEASIKEMLRIDNLSGKTILDIGCGSGLFSLAARNLGASKVHSFDYDPKSVACAAKLRKRHFPNDPNWIIEQGSVLQKEFLRSMGKFDVVYSWGVLHHTGDMWSAIENAASLVKENGTLFIALYNDQGIRSTIWKRIKSLYCSNIAWKIGVCCTFIPYFSLKAALVCLIIRRNVFIQYKNSRGMSITHDWFDWLGGYPFEVAKVEEVFWFLRSRGFQLDNIKTTCGLGNNQFVLVRKPN